jgi:hypothetical protein
VTAPVECDVAVVGGGAAGIAAAVAAARCGARTVLLERGDGLGGNVAHALVHTICGLYRAAAEGAAVQAHAGLPREFAARLTAAGGAAPAERVGQVYVLPTDPEIFAATAARLCDETPGLTWRAGCEVVAVELPAAVATPARLALGGGGAPVVLHARVVVDASGDGVAATLAGAEVAMAAPAALQLPSFIFRMTGVDTRALHGFARLKISHAVAGAVRFGKLPAGCESILARPATASDAVWLTLNLPRPAARDYAPLDAACVAEMERRARAGAETIAAFLKATRPEFAHGHVDRWPRRIGIRETRRVRGRAELTTAAVLAGRRCDDEVALSTWPIELWDDHARPRFEQPAGPCSIALGALVSRSHPRLGMAGRCISATHEALGAVRVIGTSMATGEAVGTAAALAADARSTLADVAPTRVRARLAALADGGGAR